MSVFELYFACDIFLSFGTVQRDNVIEPQGQEQIRKILRSPCLDGVATPNIVKMPNPTTLRPANIVTLSRQYCDVPTLPSSDILRVHNTVTKIKIKLRC